MKHAKLSMEVSDCGIKEGQCQDCPRWAGKWQLCLWRVRCALLLQLCALTVLQGRVANTVNCLNGQLCKSNLQELWMRCWFFQWCDYSHCSQPPCYFCLWKTYFTLSASARRVKIHSIRSVVFGGKVTELWLPRGSAAGPGYTFSTCEHCVTCNISSSAGHIQLPLHL